MEKRKGFRFVTELPGAEKFVSMIEFKGDVYVCTDRSMYKMVGECLERMNIQISDNEYVVQKEQGRLGPHYPQIN